MTGENSPGPSGTGDPDRPAFRVVGGDGPVTVRKFPTKRGERVEIATDDDNIRLDALILESFSWQRDRADIAALLDEGAGVLADETPVTGGDPVADSLPFQVTNEYTQVTLKHVSTAAGDALQVETPTRGSALNLGVSSLRALAAHDDTFAFSAFFRTPVGPEDTPVEGPH